MKLTKAQPQTSVQDRVDLYDLAVRYAAAVDEKNWLLLEDVFAEEMAHYRVFGSRVGYEQGQPSIVAAGRAQAVNIHRAFLEPLRQTHHILGNVLGTVHGETGELTYYLRAYHEGQGEKAGLLKESLAFASASVKRLDVGWRMLTLDYVVYISVGSSTLLDNQQVRDLIQG